MRKSTYAQKLAPLTEPLRAELDALPLWGVLVRDTSAHEWNPSPTWNRHVQEKLGKQFSRRQVGNILLLIRIK